MVNLITGTQGSGKTSFLLGYVRSRVAEGRSVGGVAAPAVFSEERREGYDVIDLASGQRRTLCRVGTPGEGALAVGPYVFDPATLAAGNAAIVEAIRGGLDVIAIDEIGPLEFRGSGWAPSLATALEECTTSQELLVAVRPSLVDRLPGQFPSSRWSAATTLAPPWPGIEGGRC
ncbi:MAG: nucleoside-triphosphatase [Phycisphaerae bacterium]|jgi:nucleoside-triphosphatase THEP1